MIGVYIARAADGTVLYVGASGNIDKRLAVHKSTAKWWPATESIETIPTDSRFLAFDLERQKILELSPLHNITSQGGRKRIAKARGPVLTPRTVVLARVIEEHGNVANLARACGVDHQTMSQIWRGVSFPSNKVIARLMFVTGLTFDDLFQVEMVGTSVDPADWAEARAPRTPRIPKPRAAA